MFLEYKKQGIIALPIGYLTKYPCKLQNGNWVNFKGWHEYKPTDEDCKEWDTWFDSGCGVGIVLGEPSGVIALDFDQDNEFTDAIKKLLPYPPVRKVGSKGVTAFFKYSGEKNKKWKVEGEKDYCLELLSTGNQTVVPPSFHPATQKQYTWLGSSLLEYGVKNLPTLPEDFISKVDEIVNPKPVVLSAPPVVDIFEKQESTIEDAKNAISFLNPDCDYEEWLEIGMALKDGYGHQGFDVWDNWSRGGSKYPKAGSRELLNKFNSFQRSGITKATLFHKAQLCGYKKEYEQQPIINNFTIPLIERLKLEATPSGAKERLEEGFPLHLCRGATGLVGLVQDWIENSAMFPQPALALGAAISAVGIMYAHKVEGETGSRTNMYCLGVAPSGSGKEHPRKAVDALLDKTGYSEAIGGDPASSTGLLKSLQNGNGKRIVQIDEFGRVLKGMNSKNASAHASGLPTVMMKLFSSASGKYFGTEYANHDGKMNRQDIEQPCLCIHASTVPEHLYQAMTGTDAIDGFLSRWLIFENKGYPDFASKKYSLGEVPQPIIDWIEDFKQLTNVDGNLAMFGIKPKTIPFDDEAREMANDFCRSMRKRAQEKQEAGDSTYAIWTRTFEHATKLALVGQENGIINAKVMKWALEVATYCSQYICDQAVAYIADNEQEKNVKGVLEIIKIAGRKGLEHKDLTKKTYKLSRKDRNDIITSLVESEQIRIEQIQTTTKPKIKYFYNF